MATANYAFHAWDKDSSNLRVDVSTHEALVHVELSYRCDLYLSVENALRLRDALIEALKADGTAPDPTPERAPSPDFSNQEAEKC